MFIGVDLGGTNIRAGLIQEGRIVSIKQALLSDKDSLQKTLSQLFSVISPLMSPEVSGIGVGVPSLVDIKNGIVFDAVNIPSWKKVSLKEILEKEFRIPAFINNDVNCFTLGEHRYGQGRSFSSIVGITIGTGIGAGIIINNRLYTGSNCGAGEIGSLSYLDNNFEFYASSFFFTSKFNTTPVDAHFAALEGDKESFRIWEQFGINLGNALIAVIYTYDPEAIILGGSIAKAFRFFENSMWQTLAGFPYPETIRRIKILQSNVENIALLGAAILVENGEV